MGWGSGGGWGGSGSGQGKTNAWQDTRVEDQPEMSSEEWVATAPDRAEKFSSWWRKESAGMNDGMGPYGRPAENGMPPELPLWHGHAWQPEGVEYDPATGRFTDGYVPGPGDKPQF